MNKFIEIVQESFTRSATLSLFLLVFIGMLFLPLDPKLYAQATQLNTSEHSLLQTLEADEQWNLQSTIPGLNGGVEIMVADGEDVYVSGNFNVAGGIKTGSLARYNSTQDTWHSLIDNLRGHANALLISGDYLYIGGNNLQIDDSDFISIIRYNLSTGAWQQVGQSADNVLSIYEQEEFIYFGGYFVDEDDNEVYLKRYNKSNGDWYYYYYLNDISSVSIHDMAVFGNELYLGGQFISGENERYSLIRLNINDRTIKIIDGMYYRVKKFLQYGTDLFIAGQMNTPEEAGTDYLARFDTVNEEFKPISGNINSFVDDIHISGDYLYVGGHFTSIGDQDASRVARYHLETNIWSPLEKDLLGDDLTHHVRALTYVNNELILGGSFSNSAGITVNNIVRYNTIKKTAKTLGDGLPDQVYSIAALGDDIFVSGLFTSVGSLKANHIARFNTTNQTWHSLGDGLDRAALNMIAYDNFLVVGGAFNEAGGKEIHHLARYNIDTGEWDDMNGGANGWGLATLLHDDNLYVGGGFTEIGGISAHGIARYHIPTSKWYKLESEVGGVVLTLAIGEGNLFAGGTFNSAGGFTVNKVARYNFKNKSWHKMDGGLSHEVKSMVYSDGQVYIGGTFYHWDNEYPRYLAVYDIAEDTFNSLEIDGNYEVYDLILYERDLFISTVIPPEYSGPIKYDLDNDTWQFLGSGINGYAQSMDLIGDDLYMGGLFTTAGNKPAGYIARWNLNIPVSVEPEILGPDDDFQILQNYPNPFNPTTEIAYELQTAGHVRLNVFNVTGQHIVTLVDKPQMAGRQSISFNASGLSSGIYFYRLETGGNAFIRKMTLIK